MPRPEYGIWQGMWTRCRNPKRKDYCHYGARGVTVCDRWRSFDSFLADMGPRPSPGHSIDRIDNSIGYEPANCRWATTTEQTRNQRQRIDNSSGVTGVTWKAPNRKWQVNIGHGGRQLYVGLFSTLAEAIEARKAKAAELGYNADHGRAR